MKWIYERLGVAESIRKAREALELTQAEFAKKIGMPVSTYSNYENGNRCPAQQAFEKIAEGLGVTVESLLLGGRYES